MRILNLYSGLGGNRRDWDGDVTAVEFDPLVAASYAKRYPGDTVVVGDAVKYLEGHSKGWDFIWASPPCQSHSKVRMFGALQGRYDPVVPEMSLYGIILFLKRFCNDYKWCVENVRPYYQPLIPPSAVIGKHLFWTNFHVPTMFRWSDGEDHNSRARPTAGVVPPYGKGDKGRNDQAFRNQVPPELGELILRKAFSLSPKADAPDIFS